MNVSLSPIEQSELPALLELDQQCFIDFWSESQWMTYLSNAKRFRVLAIRLDEKAIGFMLFSLLFDEAELLRIGVSPQARGKGVGEQAVAVAIDLLKPAGVERLMLEVRASNHSAIRLYEKCGFERDGFRPNYYPAVSDQLPLEDALLMSKGL